MFCCDVRAVIRTQFNQCARAIDFLAHAKGRAGPTKWVQHSVAFLGSQLDASFNQVLVQLGWVERSALLAVACNSWVVEHLVVRMPVNIAWNSPSGLRSFISIQLSPAWHLHLFGIQPTLAGITNSPTGSVVVSEVVVVMLPKCKHLDAWLVLNITHVVED